MKSSFLKNLSVVFGAQILVLLISVIRALVLPKFLSVESFGYWEIYWFYTSYVGIFSLGYNDGIYLKYGECDVSQLPIKLIRSANRLFLMLLFIIAFCVIMIARYKTTDSDILYSISFAAFNIVVMGITGIYIYIYQITKQFKKYSFFSVIDKLLVLITILLMLIINERNFKTIVTIDFMSKIFALICMTYKMPAMLFGERASIKESFSFLFENISVGIKLMIANLMSMLLVGAGKFIVQILGDISDFAIYSFGVSITGMVLTAVTAISLVLYPTVKRIVSSEYSNLFNKINSITRVLGLFSLLLYFPVYLFVELFYPHYSSVLAYLSFLFLIVYFQCKISLLNNTFYKVLRKEKQMLIANMSCVVLFVLLALLMFTQYPEMKTIALCTFIAMSIRCYASEVSLSKEIIGRSNNRILVEIFFIILFIISTIYLSTLTAAMVYIFAMIIWLLIDVKERNALKYILLNDILKKISN